MMKRIILFSILALTSLQTTGQNGGGSIYSIYGIGELRPTMSAQNVAMGFTSIGMSNPYYVNQVNPAANAEIGGYFAHIFDMGMFINQTQLQSANATENVSDGGLSQLNFWFRLNRRWSAMIGMTNYSNVGYNLVDEDVLVSNNRDFSVNYQGSGGLSNIYFSNTLSITKNLSVGARFSFIFGNIFNNEIATTTQSGEAFDVQNSTHISQVNMDFGMNYRIPLGNEKALNIGMIYDSGTQLSGNVNSIITSANLETIYDEQETTEEYSLPEKFGLGLSYRNKQFLIGSDIEYNNWSNASIPNQQDLQNTLRASVGLEYTPDRQGETFSQRMSYRFGAYVENSYLKIDDTSFNRWGLTTGLAIPLRNANVINLSYHRKYNGTLDNGLILESTNEFVLSVTIKERWFVKTKYF